MKQIDLSGLWKMHMEAQYGDEPPYLYDDTIFLPDSTSHARKGPRSDRRCAEYLTDPYAFEGCLWVRREVDIPSDWAGMDAELLLERTRLTALWLDGAKIGEQDSLCAPHRYPLPCLSTGRHILEIAVRNTGYPTPGGHMTSADTQTNWLGILGRMELRALPTVRVEDIRILKETSTEKVAFSLRSTGKGLLSFTVDGAQPTAVRIKQGVQTLLYDAPEKLARWDEFSPALHTLSIELNGEAQDIPFGIRSCAADGRKLLVNGRETFLRGKHDGMLFPETGYAPMDVDGWMKVMKTAKAYGVNHYRFHTCCPPEAAFIAADRLGIYMEPELPFWATVAEEENDEQRYLTEEGFRILKEYGNHPSFVMLSLGNELWGSKERLNRILASFSKEDPRPLYTDGSNNFQFAPTVLEEADFLCGVRLGTHRLYRGSYAMCDAPQGFVQTDEPNTVHCYDEIIAGAASESSAAGGALQVQYGTGVKEVHAQIAGPLIPHVPVLSHEVGQYESYPDYKSIPRFTGVLKAENLALFREKAQAKGLLRWSDRFFMASGALAAACYKLEIEAALKSRELAGFQLLDLQDYTGQRTSLVGVLNAFMEPKGFLSEEQWRGFCAPTVIMAALPKFVYERGETLTFDVLLSNTDPDFRGSDIVYRIECFGRVLTEGKLPLRLEGRVSALGKVIWRIPELSAPAACTLTLAISGTDVKNSYRLGLYPKCDIAVSEEQIRTAYGNIAIAHDLETAAAMAEKGAACLFVPDAEGKLEGSYCTNFWNYPMFRNISARMNKKLPIGTLGCLIDRKHPALKLFPAEEYSTPDWYFLVTHSHCEDLSDSAIEPIVWFIDNPERAQKLALLYEQPTQNGKVMTCTSRLWEIAGRPEVRWFAASIARYLLQKNRES